MPRSGATDLAARFRSVRAATEALADPLSPEDQTAQSMPDVSPTKWHRAHTTWFFETFVLERFEPDFRPYDPAYRTLFNSYYETLGSPFPRPDRGVITRPGAAEVGDYRRSIDDRMCEVLTASAHPGIGDLAGLVEIGLQHEQQHQELLLMDIKHVLSCNPAGPAYREAPCAPAPPSRPGPTDTGPTDTGPTDTGPTDTGPTDTGPTGRHLVEPARWIAVEGGIVEIGHSGDGFAFDNERPRHRVLLEPFEIADRLVTVGEWRAFVDDGGYRRPELWLSDGWAMVSSSGWEAPLYWRRGDDWIVHTLFGLRPLDDAEPVCHVSHYEADAFARWAGARLPTEHEWEHAATVHAATGHPTGHASGDPHDGADATHLHPRPAPPRPSSTVRQLVGSCWQWTASAYLPYPGFARADGAVGEYNGKFMSNQMVLRGGSALTPPGHTRPTYRNFFPPAARWPMTGLRLAR